MLAPPGEDDLRYLERGMHTRPRSRAHCVVQPGERSRRGATALETAQRRQPMARPTVTCIMTGVALVATVRAAGQSPSARAPAGRPARSASVGVAADKAWSVPRMPDGHPDFQGVWANNGMTPLERPKQFGLRATMSDAELADVKKRATA